jgi:hypothetical protein
MGGLESPIQLLVLVEPWREILMPEVAHAGENHSKAFFVRGVDHFLVVD